MQLIAQRHSRLPQMVPAKIASPILALYYRRKRLFRLLDQASHKKIVWINGPAGSGKTTLIASYLKEKNLTHLWYRVDDRDTDPATIFYYLDLAEKEINPGRHKPLRLPKDRDLSVLEAFSRYYFEDLYQRFQSIFIIVFDNYQDVADDVTFQEVLRNAIELLPSHGQVIVMSRSPSPPALARLSVHQHMAKINWEDLRLSSTEINGISKLFRKEKFNEAEIDKIEEIIHGWVAGLVIWLNSTNISLKALASKDLKAPEIVYDYFANEIFEHLDKELSEFLVKIALLPEISVDILSEFTERKDASQLLSYLVEKNCFIYQSDNNPKLYQYHPLFKAFLIKRVATRYTPEELLTLQHKAAEVLLKYNQYENAVELLQKTRQWGELSKLICQHAAEIVTQGRLNTLFKWIMALPEPKLLQNPRLQYWLGICRMPFDAAEAEYWFEKAYVLFELQGSCTDLLSAWAGVVDAIFYNLTNYRKLEYYIKKLENIYSKAPIDVSIDIEARITNSMFQALVWRKPHHSRIKYWERRARHFWETISDVGLRISLGKNLTLYYGWMGCFKESNVIMMTLGLLAKSSDALPFDQLNVYALGIYHYGYIGDKERGWQSYAKAIRIIRKYKIQVSENLIVNGGIYLALSTGELDKAEALLERVGAFIALQKPDLNSVIYYRFKGWYACLRDNSISAVEYSKRAVALAMKLGAVYPRTMCYYGLAFALYDQGKIKAARFYLDKAQKLALATKNHWLEYCHLLAESYFDLKMKKLDSGLKSLSKAMMLGREHELWHSFRWHPHIMVYLCTQALAQGIEKKYVRQLIIKRHLIPDETSLEIDNWPWQVEIYTLGRFSILFNGTEMQSGGKAQKKPLEILKALIAHGGQSVSKDKLADLIWPSAEGDKAYQAFATTLHRLRKMLGNEEAIELKDGRLFLNRRICWVDAWAFERISAQAEAVFIKEKSANLIHIIERAADLYKGPFLADDFDVPWVIPFRERVRSKFIRNIARLSVHLKEAGELERAVVCLQRGLEVEDLSETFYQLLMRCWHQLGFKTEVKEAYFRCEKTYMARLGHGPSEETTAFYRSLLRQ